MSVSAGKPVEDPQLSRLEAVLMTHSAVADCAATRRSTESGDAQVVVYFVPAEPISSSDLEAHVGAFAGVARPSVFVPVSTLPMTDRGDIDYDALSRVSVPDPALERSWQSTLEAGAAGPVAVLVDESERSRLPLHLDDLLSTPGSALSADAVVPDTVGCDEAVARPADADAPAAAIAVGESLEVSADVPTSLVDVLSRAARRADTGIVHRAPGAEDVFESYERLAGAADRMLSGLRSSGVRTGERVLLQLARPRDFIHGFWGAVLGGFVPVPMAVPASFRQRSASQSLENVWRLLGEPVVLTTRDRRDEIADVLADAGAQSASVLAVDDLELERERGGSWHAPSPDDVALLMLTSGSTGVPKAVQLTHRNLITRTLASIQMNGFTGDEVSLNWMPLDHVAGLIYFHLRDTQLQCRQIQLPTAAVVEDPLTWLDAMDQYRVSVTFAPNFAYGLVNDREREIARRRWDLSSVRFVLNGAEAIVAKTARRFLSLLEPHGLSPAAMHPAWGMSETSSGVTYSDAFSLATTSDDDEFVEVGRPIPGLSMRIVDSLERVVKEGDVGALHVKGAVVTKGYLNNESATSDAFTDDGWFKTGDLGVIRDGRLTITGREKDVVIINSVKYYSHAIESAVEDVDGVVTSFTAACAVRERDIDTDRLAVFFHPVSFDKNVLSKLLKRVRAAITDAVGIGVDYLVPVAAAEIPKTSLGKIQRSLLAERFMQGVYRDALRDVDRLSAGANTIPDWFHRKVWVPKDGRRSPSAAAAGRWLVFVDGSDTGRALVEMLPSDDVAVSVEPSDAFERKSKTSYRIRADVADDYSRLLAGLVEDEIAPDRIVHLWGSTAEDGRLDADALEKAQARGSLSVLYLAQALAGSNLIEDERALAVVGSGVAAVSKLDRVFPERCPVLGLVKSIPQEMPTIRCVHIDHDARGSAAARLILDELALVPKEREVAYRDGVRYVARLAPAAFSPTDRVELPFRAGGTYVVTGGLGGLGFEIAKFLLRDVEARVLLIGRSRRPLSGEREQRFNDLTRYSENVAYEAVDATDFEGLRAVFREYERRGDVVVEGAVHLAGEYSERLVFEESREGFESLLLPRALGAVNLARLLEERGGGVLVTASSVAGFFGGASIASYAAANAFLDGFHERLVTSSTIRSYCFQWSHWDGIGQARQSPAKDLPRSLGYLPIAADRAILSYRIGLSHGPDAILVGLDPDNRHVRRYVCGAPENLEKVFVYAGHDDADALSRSADLRDRFGTPVPSEIVPMDVLPLDDEGRIDRRQLRAVRRSLVRGEASGSRPETGSERAVAAIWQKILGAADVAADDSFFELGGDSLLAVRALSQVRDELGVELSLRSVFENPRLSDLASAIDAVRASAAATGPAVAVSGDAMLDDPESLLERLDELDDHEVETLLGLLGDDHEETT